MLCTLTTQPLDCQWASWRQAVVHAEQSATQSSHVTDPDCRNVTSAETSITSRVVCNRRWCQSTSGWADEVLGVVPNQRLTFEKHAAAVAKLCSYHAQAIRHIRHLLRPDVVQMLACSMILSRIAYCNALLHDTRAMTIHKLLRVQNNAAQTMLQVPRWSDAKPLLCRLHSVHWLPVDQRIIYNTAVLTFKVQNTANTSLPLPQSPHTDTRLCVELCSSGALLLAQTSRRTDFLAWGVHYVAPAVLNLFTRTVLDSSS